MDVDVSAMVLTDGKAGEDGDFVYYGSPDLEHPSGAIKHSVCRVLVYARILLKENF